MEKTWGLVIALAVFQPHAPGEASSTSSVSGFPYQVICWLRQGLPSIRPLAFSNPANDAVDDVIRSGQQEQSHDTGKDCRHKTQPEQKAAHHYATLLKANCASSARIITGRPSNRKASLS
jgi:hypothetical protein